MTLNTWSVVQEYDDFVGKPSISTLSYISCRRPCHPISGSPPDMTIHGMTIFKPSMPKLDHRLRESTDNPFHNIHQSIKIMSKCHHSVHISKHIVRQRRRIESLRCKVEFFWNRLGPFNYWCFQEEYQVFILNFWVGRSIWNSPNQRLQVRILLKRPVWPAQWDRENTSLVSSANSTALKREAPGRRCNNVIVAVQISIGR